MNAKLKSRMAIMKTVREAIRSPYAWPGGYPVSVIMSDGEALCPKCAKGNHRQIAHDTLKGWRTGWDAAGADVIWEGDCDCAQCGAQLEAYPTEERMAKSDTK